MLNDNDFCKVILDLLNVSTLHRVSEKIRIIFNKHVASPEGYT